MISAFQGSAQSNQEKIKVIRQMQEDDFAFGEPISFVSDGATGFHLQQIILVRHGEPVMEKKAFLNRSEAQVMMIKYDSVGVHPFQHNPLEIQAEDSALVFTSLLPRSIDTAEKCLGSSVQLHSLALFNEFDRSIMKFPDISMPAAFWSAGSRILWMLGLNHDGVERFGAAKTRAASAARYLDDQAVIHGKIVLFGHGFLNRYVQKKLKKMGYEVLNFNGRKYLGAYYIYKIKER